MVFITTVSNRQDLRELFKKARAFKIDGLNVAKWAIHLSTVYKLPAPDPNILRQYTDLEPGEVPRSMMDAAVFARNDDDAAKLANAYIGDREGYANAAQMPTAETLAKAAISNTFNDDNGKFTQVGGMT